MRRSNNGAASASTMFERLPVAIIPALCPLKNASILGRHSPSSSVQVTPDPVSPAWWNNHSKRQVFTPSARSA